MKPRHCHQVKFGFALPPKAAREFLAAAKWHDKAPADLAVMLVNKYLHDRRKIPLIVGLPAELAVIAETRLSILNEWSRARGRESKGKLHLAHTMAMRFAMQSHGIRLSLGTLYNWRRSYGRFGPAGLIDHRRWKQYARPDSVSRQRADRAIEGPSNGVQQVV
jgi:hypothetical protein